jgi:ubiquinone/menaquinone biosynthesis C-methylase UbiE
VAIGAAANRKAHAEVTAITTANVFEAFDEAAPNYDLMVGLNPGYHDHLRSAAEALVQQLPTGASDAAFGEVRLADLGCGSGASTRAVLRAAYAAGLRPVVVGVDASAGMLNQALAKSWPPGVTFEVGMAEELAYAREDWGLGERVPGVFAAYLFRNVTERDKVLATVFDLLADDGTLVVQEYSVSGSRLARAVSVQIFIDRLYDAGFVDVEVRTVPGWQRGILHTFRARRPATTRDS